ncbi:late competence development ComFB family protein [Glaciecola sp. XM2]|uniref:late competence development ComFB family protein n=1 Tax=Glaciecola sp. XM2 TaxID=1914931 RepID=UPI001BDF17F3|nr:late competence development ComFB family protein [Glaciecola sp. XM2]MBT1450880.1 late competence development ComFB family protein [Glaciecola sp. XM2]
MKLDNDIHNYYEQLVLEKLDAMEIEKTNSDPDYLADLTCLVLNQLPPRYIRHEVDMAFYLPGSERQQMEMNIVKAIQSASEYLQTHFVKDKTN